MQATILLLDDSPVQAATRKAILERAGYFVIAVLSPQLALERFRSKEFPAVINLVITDHMMPGMSGAEFVRHLRGFEPAVPVLVISGMAEAQDEYGGTDVTFRMKPLPPDHLLACVHRLITGS